MRFAKAAALAAAALLTLAPAASATTYTVAVGASTTVGNVPFTATTGGFEINSDYGVPITCSSGTMQGNVQRGATFTPPNANTVATITGTTWNGCILPTLFNTQLTFAHVGTWNLKADSAPVNGVVSGTITNISMKVRSVVVKRCDFDVIGSVDVALDSNAQTLTIEAGTFDLEVTNADRCWGEFLNGDRLDFSGGWPVQPTTYAFSTTGGNLTFQ